MKHVSSPSILDAMENNFPDACPQIIGKLTSVKNFWFRQKKGIFHRNPPLKWFQFF